VASRIYFISRADFRKWLAENHGRDEPVWVVFYKDKRGGITYREALEEALAFGWIDSLIKKIDERRYVRKFSRRNTKSKWSQTNKNLAAELLRKGLMTEHGMKAVNAAKANGQWEKEDERTSLINIEGLRKILREENEDVAYFDSLSMPLKEHYSMVYYSAKTEATRKKRLEIVKEYMKTKKRFM
jgi:uncharacterized protein YdeI (YjbR/CyaY-like superfamily)